MKKLIILGLVALAGQTVYSMGRFQPRDYLKPKLPKRYHKQIIDPLTYECISDSGTDLSRILILKKIEGKYPDIFKPKDLRSQFVKPRAPRTLFRSPKGFRSRIVKPKDFKSQLVRPKAPFDATGFGSIPMKDPYKR